MEIEKILIGIITIILLAFAELRLFVHISNARFVFGEEMAPCPNTPNCVSTLTDDVDKKMDAVRVSKTSVQIVEILNSMGGKIVISRPDYVRAEFSTPLMRYVDDVEVKISKNKIDFRSASRLGHSDLGLNRKRMEDFVSRVS